MIATEFIDHDKVNDRNLLFHLHFYTLFIINFQSNNEF